MVENPWVKDSDSAYDETGDGDELACATCTDTRDDVAVRDGKPLCDLCALLENKYGPCDDK